MLEFPPIMDLCVIHVVESLEPQAGSVAVSLGGLSAALGERGIESDAITLDRNRTVFGVGRSTPFEPRTAARIVQDAAVVHLHGWGGQLSRSMAGAARKLGKPYVISPLGGLCQGPHNIQRRRDRLRMFLSGNRLIREAAAVTVLNAAEERAVRDSGLNDEVRVLPYGLRFSDYEAKDHADGDLPAALDGRCLLLLGPIHPVEGLVPLMKAFAEIGTEADGWHMVLAGRQVGQWRKMLEAAIRRKGGADRVLFASAPDVMIQRAWLARASALATPSLHQRCPVSTLQAMAAGVAVIASDRVAPDGLENAICVCHPTWRDLADALRRVFQLSDEDREAFARKARDAGRLLLDWSVLANQYVELYKSIA